jgi:hypothetical protein
MSKAALISALGMLISIISVEAHAFPGSPVPLGVQPPAITQVRGFCGLGAHRGPYGYCVRNGVPYGYVAPPVVVAPRMVCPYPTHYDPGYGGCVI